jgi:hypothetical protein
MFFLPEPASANLFRTVHKRSSEARRAAKKARLTPAEKKGIWEDRRACDREVGVSQREHLLSQRLAPHHSITPPLDRAPNARRTSRYDEVFQYYQRHAGDTDLEVLMGIDRPNVTGDPWQRGVFATRDLLPPRKEVPLLRCSSADTDQAGKPVHSLCGSLPPAVPLITPNITGSIPKIASMILGMFTFSKTRQLLLE